MEIVINYMMALPVWFLSIGCMLDDLCYTPCPTIFAPCSLLLVLCSLLFAPCPLLYKRKNPCND